MKAHCRTVVMAGCVLIAGIACAAKANPRLRPSSENSTTTVSARSSNEKQAAVASQSKSRKEANTTNARRESGPVLNKSQVRKQAKLPMPTRPKQARNIRGNSQSQHAGHTEQSTLKKPGAVTGKTAKAQGPAPAAASRRSNGSAIGGQQSRYGRNLATAPATLGESATARRSAQGINGSEVHRRY